MQRTVYFNVLSFFLLMVFVLIRFHSTDFFLLLYLAKDVADVFINGSTGPFKLRNSFFLLLRFYRRLFIFSSLLILFFIDTLAPKLSTKEDRKKKQILNGFCLCRFIVLLSGSIAFEWNPFGYSTQHWSHCICQCGVRIIHKGAHSNIANTD